MKSDYKEIKTAQELEDDKKNQKLMGLKFIFLVVKKAAHKNDTTKRQKKSIKLN